MAAPNGFPPQEAPSPYRWWILIGLIVAAIMEVLDTTIINVSLPQMAGNLGATSEEIGWVSTGYILSNVVVLPMTAWLASRFGRRSYLLASILIFIIASFFCGTSGSLFSLVFWRVIQGAGGAALLSTSQATLREIFPASQQGMVQTIYILGIIIAPTLGPTLGGVITDNYSWHWNFLINLPIGMISFGLVYAFLQDSKFKMATKKVDWLGIGLLTVGLASVQYVLEEGNAKAWFDSSTIITLTITAITTLSIFVWWELHRRNPEPVVNLRVLKNRDLSVALILYVVLGFGLYGGIFIFPMFAQNILHLSPTETGLVLLPGGLATGFMGMMYGRFIASGKVKADPRYVIAVGLGLFFLSMYFMSVLPSTSGISDTYFPLIIRGLGVGLLFAPINMIAFGSLKGAEIAQGSGLLNLTRQLGGSLGIAILGSYVTRQAAMARSGLVAHISSDSAMVQQRIQGVSTMLGQPHGYSPDKAEKLGYALMDRTVATQALTIAYNGAFTLLAIIILCSVPALLLLKKAKVPATAVAVDAH